MATQNQRTGPRLRVEGSCEGCCHLRTGNVVLACSHPQIRKEPTGVAIVSMKAKHEDWDMRGNTRHDCPELPAARLALARSVSDADERARWEAVRAQAEKNEVAIRERNAARPAMLLAFDADPRNAHLVGHGCAASRGDGECHWIQCPQERDHEPGETGRHCPLDRGEEDQ